MGWQERQARARDFVSQRSAESLSRIQEVFERIHVADALNDVRDFWGEGEIAKGPDETGFLVLASDPIKLLAIDEYASPQLAGDLAIKLETMHVGVSFVDKDINGPFPTAKQKLRLSYQRFPLYEMDEEIDQAELSRLNGRELNQKLSELTKGEILIGIRKLRGRLEFGHIDDPDAVDRFNLAMVNIIGNITPEKVRQQQQQIIELLPLGAINKLLSARLDQSLSVETQRPTRRGFLGIGKVK